LRFALLWWLLPLIGLWLVQWWVPAYVDRYLLFASIGFYLGTGYAVTNVVRAGAGRWAPPAVVIAAMALSFTPWKDNDQHPSRVAAQVRAWQGPAAKFPVLVHPFWYKPTLWAHMDRSVDRQAPWSQAWSEQYNDASGMTPLDAADTLILVYMAAKQEEAPPQEVEGLRKVEERQADALVRVALYAR
jgi:hypothetical protein